MMYTKMHRQSRNHNRHKRCYDSHYCRVCRRLRRLRRQILYAARAVSGNSSLYIRGQINVN